MSLPDLITKIPAWRGASLVGKMLCVRPHELDKNGGRIYGTAVAVYADLYGQHEVQEFDVDPFVVDLSDQDTLAAFDRRLALRLGAPAEEVRDGVMVRLDDSFLSVFVGMVEANIDGCWENIPQRDVGPNFDLKTTDPTLARVLAWLSVN